MNTYLAEEEGNNGEDYENGKGYSCPPLQFLQIMCPVQTSHVTGHVIQHEIKHQLLKQARLNTL